MSFVKYGKWIELGNKESITINRKTLYYSKTIEDDNGMVIHFGITISKNGNVRPYIFTLINIKSWIIEICKNNKVRIR